MPFHFDTGDRVIKTQHGCMKRLAVKFTQRGDKRFRSTFWRTRTATINRIAHQRMSDMGHMHADLVRTSSFQTQPQTRVHTEVFHDAIVSHRWFAHRMHRHVSTFGRVATDWLIHRTASGHMTNCDSFILTSNFTPLQRFD